MYHKTLILENLECLYYYQKDILKHGLLSEVKKAFDEETSIYQEHLTILKHIH